MAGRLHSWCTAVCEIQISQGSEVNQPQIKQKHLQQEEDLTSRTKMGTLLAHDGTELKVGVEKYLACLLPGDCSRCSGDKYEKDFVWWECSMW